MKQWNSLLKKEWVSMKWPILLLAAGAVLLISIVPYFISKIFGPPVNAFEIAIVMSFICAIIATVVPVLTLLTLLEREMKRPDVWLHSTASIFQLIGVKAVFAVIIGAISLFIPSIVLLVRFLLTEAPGITFYELLVFGIFFVTLLFIGSISILTTGLLFWVIYRMMKPYVKGFSIPATIILFFVTMYLYTRLLFTAFYEKIIMTGPIDLTRFVNVNFTSEFFDMTMEQPIFYTGQMIVDTGLTIAMFIGAVILFEKKVRL